MLDVTISGLHFKLHRLRAGTGLAGPPERSCGKRDAGAGGGDVIARLDFEVQIGWGFEVGEGREESSQQELRCSGPEQEGDEHQQQQHGRGCGATNDGLHIHNLMRTNGLHPLRDMLLQTLLHDFGTRIRKSLRGAVNRYQGCQRFLKIGESQVNGGTKLFRGETMGERSQQAEPGAGCGARNHQPQEQTAEGARQHHQEVQQAGDKQTDQQHTDRLGKSPCGGVQPYAALTLIQQTLQTRDLSQDSGRH
ncbi:MAG: hypothetical protein RLZZ436_4061 [Planctomycetota bacterium]